jgi:hypothetical protein
MEVASMITVPQSTLPSTLYKSFAPERVDIIPYLQVRFSPPSDFNDAFDTHHLLPRTSGANAKVARDSLRTNLGVFCLTEQADNHLMWVNYARSHSGFVLGFKADAQFFDQDGRTLRKVVYQSTPPVFSAADENGCFYKSPDWKYEKEWRCVRSFSNSESRLVEIEPTFITEIIFGHLMEPGNIAYMTWYAKAHEMNPTFSKSSPSHSHWKFVNKPKRVAPCEHCSGQGFLMDDP